MTKKRKNQKTKIETRARTDSKRPPSDLDNNFKCFLLSKCPPSFLLSKLNKVCKIRKFPNLDWVSECMQWKLCQVYGGLGAVFLCLNWIVLKIRKLLNLKWVSECMRWQVYGGLGAVWSFAPLIFTALGRRDRTWSEISKLGILGPVM